MLRARFYDTTQENPPFGKTFNPHAPLIMIKRGAEHMHKQKNKGFHTLPSHARPTLRSHAAPEMRAPQKLTPPRTERPQAKEVALQRNLRVACYIVLLGLLLTQIGGCCNKCSNKACYAPDNAPFIEDPNDTSLDLLDI